MASNRLRHARAEAVGYLAAVAIAIVVALGTREAWDAYSQWKIDNQDVTEWVEYHSIGFVDVDPDARGGFGSLRMFSDRTVHHRAELLFIDTLMCRTPDDTEDRFEFVTQNAVTEAFFLEPQPRHVGRWLYNADYPIGRECIVRSVIEVTVEGTTKRIVIESASFTVR